MKKKRRKASSFIMLKGFVLPALLIAIWQGAAASQIVSSTVLPAPTVIAESFRELIRSGELFGHLYISLYRAICGFLLGGGLGLAMGLCVGFSRKTEQYVDPTLQMLRTVPHLAVTPLFILWFGFDESAKILLIALGAFFPIYINTFLGIRSVDNKLFDVARALEFNLYQNITKLILPAALPHILLGVRLSLGIAWLGLVVAELMGSSSGVGYMIMDARQFSQTDKVFVGIIIFAVVGKMTDSFVRLLEKRLLKWRTSYQGGK
ncbi:ABC transporter permease [Bacillus altitudinis]|uniref:ABC transporter permease n=1 Tax=Bacillus altitudinis TaxID=293387 RepID=UPI001FB7453F|nr:ABC transporter permease [Bacillus altitudinis]UOG09524.1 ABC transporter permease [Bacillus altitudinis]